MCGLGRFVEGIVTVWYVRAVTVFGCKGADTVKVMRGMVVEKKDERGNAA